MDGPRLGLRSKSWCSEAWTLPSLCPDGSWVSRDVWKGVTLTMYPWYANCVQPWDWGSLTHKYPRVKKGLYYGDFPFSGVIHCNQVHLTIIPPKRCPVTAMGLKELLMEPVEMYFTRVFYIPGGAISLSSTVSSQLHHEIWLTSQKKLL